MGMILSSTFYHSDVLNSTLRLPPWFLAQTQACAVSGVFFSPWQRADWGMLSECVWCWQPPDIAFKVAYMDVGQSQIWLQVVMQHRLCFRK